jgi:hypothetical protein
MGRRAKRRVCHEPIELIQDSPFLRLPGEIRTKIYYACLVKPTSIDLWPNEFFEETVALNDAAMRARIDKRSPQIRDFKTPKFRRQDDLKFVRKQLSTGLLATCKQVFDEASSIFWSENVFRFSSDMEWLGIRRFLSTIGPRAISKLTSIEVCAPFIEDGCLGANLNGQHNTVYLSQYNDSRGAKNEPKMRMKKAGSAWSGTTPRWLSPDSYLSRNAEHVAFLLSQTQSNLDIRFILARDFGLDEVWEWTMLRGNRIRREVCLPNSVHEICQRYASTVSLMLEANTYINSLDVLQDFTQNQITVVFKPGSKFSEISAAGGIEFMEEKVYPANFEYEHFYGVSDLYNDSQKISVAAGGGKVNKNPGKRKTARILKAFGPDRFVSRKGFDCSCGKTGVYIAGPECDTCGRYSYRDDREVVELKRMGRAVRKGLVSGRMVSLGNRRFDEGED